MCCLRIHPGGHLGQGENRHKVSRDPSPEKSLLISARGTDCRIAWARYKKPQGSQTLTNSGPCQPSRSKKLGKIRARCWESGSSENDVGLSEHKYNRRSYAQLCSTPPCSVDFHRERAFFGEKLPSRLPPREKNSTSPSATKKKYPASFGRKATAAGNVTSLYFHIIRSTYFLCPRQGAAF